MVRRKIGAVEGTSEAIADAGRGQFVAIPSVLSFLAAVVGSVAARRRVAPWALVVAAVFFVIAVVVALVTA